MRIFWRLFLVMAFSLQILQAQTTFPTNGVPYKPHSVYALINANLYVDADHLINNGKLVFQDGQIIAAGALATIPAEAIVIDLKGKYVYPAFIDLLSSYGISPNNYPRKLAPGPQMESTVKGAYGWNMAIRADVQAFQMFHHNQEAADEYRKAGFGAVLSASGDGIVRGSGALVLLNSNAKDNESIVAETAAGLYSFDKGSSTQDYPTSLTGAIALLRQTFYDATWYNQSKEHSERNISLEEITRLQILPAIVDVNDKYQILRVAKLSQEFKIPFIVKAGGNEYQRLAEIKAGNLRLIVPLDFPTALDVEDPYDAENVSLADLKHWELAPANPKFLEQAGISFALSAADLKDKNTFLNNLRKAVQYGLSENAALKALTLVPATYLGLQNRIGTLNKGMLANFIICNKSIFEEDALVLENWSGGQRSAYANIDAPDIRGLYELRMGAYVYDVTLSGDPFQPKAVLKLDTAKKSMSFHWNGAQINFSASPDSANSFRASGLYQADKRLMEGNAQLQDGTWTNFKMKFVRAADTAQKKKESPKAASDLGEIYYPFSAYGQSVVTGTSNFVSDFTKSKKNYTAILIKNVSIWTNEKEGILKEQDVLVVGDRIQKIGKNIAPPAGAKIMDGTGKHLTPGIIDEHSHIALTGGVNESAEASTAEVRMGDVINPEDINIYRQLSGGVTAAQLLHGSANPIGGQSAIIKLRWGLSAEDLKITNADPFIKFALGENVKQSNWGDLNSVRFPQSRMGVEQVYVDLFTRARAYDKAQSAFKLTKDKSLAPRRDIELEALAEILNSKRFITCHSYVQSEINMLMHVADTFGFRVNTFTHILEGYKVADKMKAHGVNASTFSDWWAYKNEVMDAIPYNAAILTRMGVVTAINSDDAEMARRLNQEAAKCFKYGALTEEEALKMVTLNPAIMLHLDKEIGSIKVGKSADLVIWSDNPLSVYAKAEVTMIEGLIYFDRERDAQLRAQIITERARLINKLLAEKQKGTPVVKPRAKRQQLYHCNTLEGISETETGQR